MPSDILQVPLLVINVAGACLWVTQPIAGSQVVTGYQL